MSYHREERTSSNQRAQHLPSVSYSLKRFTTVKRPLTDFASTTATEINRIIFETKNKNNKNHYLECHVGIVSGDHTSHQRHCAILYRKYTIERRTQKHQKIVKSYPLRRKKTVHPLAIRFRLAFFFYILYCRYRTRSYMNLHDDTVEDAHHGGNIQQVEDQRLKSTKIIKKHNQRLKTSVQCLHLIRNLHTHHVLFINMMHWGTPGSCIPGPLRRHSRWQSGRGASTPGMQSDQRVVVTWSSP